MPLSSFHHAHNCGETEMHRLHAIKLTMSWSRCRSPSACSSN